MNRASIVLAAILSLSPGVWALTEQSSQAVQLRDGTVYFVSPPRLVEASTTYNSTYAWGATYYFTLSLPEDAGEPLQRVTIAQSQAYDQLRFNLEESIAFEGTRSDQGAALPLGEVTLDPQTQTVSVVFKPPVPPGKTVTVGIRPVENPQTGGAYLFGVTAFPPGEKVHGQFIGYGRIHFYERRSFLNRRWFYR